LTRKRMMVAAVVASALLAEPALAVPPTTRAISPSPGGPTWLSPSASSEAQDVVDPGWAAADVTGPRPVIRTRRIIELGYAESDGYRAWGTIEGRRGRLHVYAQKKGERRRRLSTPLWDTAMGGVDSHRLVYQEIRFARARSNIRLFNMETGRRTNPGRRVNSRMWEYSPSISGHWILFFRTNFRETRNWGFLYNTTTNQRRRIDLIRGGRGVLLGGQVASSGDGGFATWTKCTRRSCQVFRYNIATRAKTRVPNPGGRIQYASGVDPDGAVYYARSGRRCGQNVGIWKQKVGQSPERLVGLPRNIDFSFGFVYRNEGQGRNQYSFNRLNCRTFRADIYEIWDDDVTQ
jgi:hypothetical protein